MTVLDSLTEFWGGLLALLAVLIASLQGLLGF